MSGFLCILAAKHWIKTRGRKITPRQKITIMLLYVKLVASLLILFSNADPRAEYTAE